ncbi:hypothetical protein [Propionibacterium freudenreichii]|uniref:hypothetical protein n=1 Tax=Propionibacterium freudenreichii TaxID=1744 RepID=UPI0021A945D5|nr:hypothetical protein [Propionibacterium freudenreichii]
MTRPDVALQGLMAEPPSTVVLAKVLAVGADGRSVKVQHGSLVHDVVRLDTYKARAGDWAVLLGLTGGAWVLIGALASE